MQGTLKMNAPVASQCERWLDANLAMHLLETEIFSGSSRLGSTPIGNINPTSCLLPACAVAPGCKLLNMV
jgi:hypothetical protein